MRIATVATRRAPWGARAQTWRPNAGCPGHAPCIAAASDVRALLAACLCIILVGGACAPAGAASPAAQAANAASGQAAVQTGGPPALPSDGTSGDEASSTAGNRALPEAAPQSSSTDTGPGSSAGTGFVQDVGTDGTSGTGTTPSAPSVVTGEASVASDQVPSSSAADPRTQSAAAVGSDDGAPPASPDAADAAPAAVNAGSARAGSADEQDDVTEATSADSPVPTHLRSASAAQTVAAGVPGPADAAVMVPAPSAAPVLDGVLDGLLPDDSADYGFVLEDLGSGARMAVNGSQVFPSASLYKLGLAWITLREVDAGALRLDEPITIEDEDCIEPEPYGGFGAGDTPTLREAVQATLSLSSNAAAHALLRLIGRDTFAQEMDRIGLPQTRVPDDGEAVTSPDDMAHLLRLIVTSPQLGAASRELIAEAMANGGPPDSLRDTLPVAVGIYDKTGNLEDASNVSALLVSQRATAILVVIDTGVDPGDARAIIAQAGMIAYHALLQN